MAKESSLKVANLKEKKTEIQLLKEKVDLLTLQNITLIKENKRLRLLAKQPDEGPLLPTWIQKGTLEKLNDADWLYRALDNKGIPMVLEKKSGKWLRMSRAIYMRHYGEIPKDYLVVPVDGNNRNFEPANWMVMSKQDFLNNSGYSFDSTDGDTPELYMKINMETGEEEDDE